MTSATTTVRTLPTVSSQSVSQSASSVGAQSHHYPAAQSTSWRTYFLSNHYSLYTLPFTPTYCSRPRGCLTEDQGGRQQSQCAYRQNPSRPALRAQGRECTQPVLDESHGMAGLEHSGIRIYLAALISTAHSLHLMPPLCLLIHRRELFTHPLCRTTSR